VKGDFSRLTFAEENHYRRVLMQQGRVQIDADGNEQIAIEQHLAATTSADVIGQAGYPLGTLPNGNPAGGFAIGLNAAGTDLTISPGRMYVDGLLVENDTPGATLLTQPDMPGVTLAALGATPPGIYVAYLDVWERLITTLDNPAIRDSALGGPDTSVRTKLVWQVKLAFLQATPGSGAPMPTCASAGEPWQSATATTGMLAAGSGAPGSSLPCILPPETGYQRLENQLYRVEIHQPGPDGTATFKWSRENGSVVALISAPPAVGGAPPPATVTAPFWVTGLNDDPSLGLQAGDWVELTDDSAELIVGRGTLYQVKTTPTDGQPVTITAATAPTATLSLHPKLRRWDQTGTGLDQGITVTTAAPIPLEGGVQVQFSAGTYQTGDYWLIPARTATSVQQGFVEWPVDASSNPVPQPPLGIRHHYAKLGLVELTAAGTFAATGTATAPADCRLPFPPLTGLINGGCCTVDVGPADVHDGASLQTLLDTYANKGPITVCLEPGTYTLPAPLVLGPELDGLTLQACREGVVLQAQSKPGDDFIPGLIVMQDTSSVTIRGIWLSVPLTPFSPPSGSFSSLPQANQSLLTQFAAGLPVAIGISVNGSAGLTIEDCTFELPDPGQAKSFGAGIFATGAMNDLEITGCTFQSANPPTTVPFNDLAAGNQVLLPYQLTFGYLQVPGASAFSPDPVPQQLHDATIEQSLFQGVTVPVLVMAQIGTLRVDRNTVRNSYAGFWFVSIADPVQLLPFFDEFAFGNTELYSFAASIGVSALLDRIFVIASAIGPVLPATPPGGGLVVSGSIQPLDTARLTLVREAVRTIFTHAATSGDSSTAPPPSTASAAVPEEEVVAAPGEAKLTGLPAEIDAILTKPGAPVAAPIPVADTGTGGLSLRLDLCDCQVDAVIADSYSGAGLLVLDLTAETGSALLHDNRIRSRFLAGQTVLLTGITVGFVGFGEACVTGNLVANEVVPVVPAGVFQGLPNYSMVLNAATTPFGVPAVAVTGNVFIDPTKFLPTLRQNIPPRAAALGLADWDLLNTVIDYIAPPVVTGINPAIGQPAGGTQVTVTGSGFTGATQVNFGLNNSVKPAAGGTDTSLTVASPPAPATATVRIDQVVDVTVVNPAGTSPIVPADQFTYFAGVAKVTAAEIATPEQQAPAAPQQQAPAAEKQAAAAPEQQRAAAEEQAPAAPEEQAPAAEDASPTAPIEIAPAVPVRPPLRVRVTNSVDEGRSFALESGELIIGREEGSAIQLQDSGVSHNHALLRVHGENVTIEDLRSTNGTKVNGAAIDGQTDLGPGDQIDVGGVQLVVEHNQVINSDQS